MNEFMFLFSSFFIGLNCFALTPGYDLKLNLSLNGKHVSSPRVITKAGETATVTQNTAPEKTFIEVIANEGEIQGHKGILIKFVVGTIDKNGKKTILSTPEVLTSENKLARISVGKDSTHPKLSMSVLALRKSL